MLHVTAAPKASNISISKVLLVCIEQRPRVGGWKKKHKKLGKLG